MHIHERILHVRKLLVDLHRKLLAQFWVLFYSIWLANWMSGRIVIRSVMAE